MEERDEFGENTEIAILQPTFEAELTTSREMGYFLVCLGSNLSRKSFVAENSNTVC